MADKIQINIKVWVEEKAILDQYCVQEDQQQSDVIQEFIRGLKKNPNQPRRLKPLPWFSLSGWRTGALNREAKFKHGTAEQYAAIDVAIRTAQFISQPIQEMSNGNSGLERSLESICYSVWRKGSNLNSYSWHKLVDSLSVHFMIVLNCGVSLDRDLNASLNILKRTVGQPFAACGGLVDAQPVRQELSCVNLKSPRQTTLGGWRWELSQFSVGLSWLRGRTAF